MPVGTGRQDTPPMLEPQHTRSSQTMTDHDTVVVKDGGSNAGLILGIIAIIIVLALGWYFLMGPGAGSSSKSSNDTNITVELPSVAPQGS
jgi:hypothetical protein